MSSEMARKTRSNDACQANNTGAIRQYLQLQDRDGGVIGKSPEAVGDHQQIAFPEWSFCGWICSFAFWFRRIFMEYKMKFPYLGVPWHTHAFSYIMKKFLCINKHFLIIVISENILILFFFCDRFSRTTPRRNNYRTPMAGHGTTGIWLSRPSRLRMIHTRPELRSYFIPYYTTHFESICVFHPFCAAFVERSYGPKALRNYISKDK